MTDTVTDPATKLVAKTPCNGLLPVTIGTVSLSEDAAGAITSLAPLKGQAAAVSDVLRAQIGARLPKPGRATGKAGARAVWSGLDQALVLGPALSPIPGAAMTDQSDAWACVMLEGQDARAVLARVTPLDLRESVFKQGHAARTELAHMSVVLIRTGGERYQVLAFRSMATTLVHDLSEAMTAVAARAAL